VQGAHHLASVMFTEQSASLCPSGGVVVHEKLKGAGALLTHLSHRVDRRVNRSGQEERVNQMMRRT
jgi:hypothetical protein